MKLTVNGDICSGHGRCYSVSPELLSFDDEGFVTIKGESIDVPEGLEDAARRALAACPEKAISIRRTPSDG